MMEFTMSRVTLMFCGAILMSVVIVPFGNIFDSSGNEELQNLAEKDASLIDTFWSSEMDEIHLCGTDLLPSPSYVLSVNGHLLRIVGEDSEYLGNLVHPLELVLHYGEETTLVRDGNGLRTQ